MIYSPFYRPRYPLPYFRRPTDNVYTYSIKQDKKGFEKENFKKDLKFLKEENDKKDTFNNEYTKIIDIFGIALYFDDLLIISLLLFLYFEGVKDDMLFLSLVLILMS